MSLATLFKKKDEQKAEMLEQPPQPEAALSQEAEMPEPTKLSAEDLVAELTASLANRDAALEVLQTEKEALASQFEEAVAELATYKAEQRKASRLASLTAVMDVDSVVGMFDATTALEDAAFDLIVANLKQKNVALEQSFEEVGIKASDSEPTDFTSQMMNLSTQKLKGKK